MSCCEGCGAAGCEEVCKVMNKLSIKFTKSNTQMLINLSLIRGV